MPVQLGTTGCSPNASIKIEIGNPATGKPFPAVPPLPVDVAPAGSADGYEADGVTPKGWAVLHSQKTPVVFPANFATLPPEEKQKILDQYRFEGIKLRADIKDRTIPLNKQIMDIP